MSAAREWVYCKHKKWVPKCTRFPSTCSDCRREAWHERDVRRGKAGRRAYELCPHGVVKVVGSATATNCHECRRAYFRRLLGAIPLTQCEHGVTKRATSQYASKCGECRHVKEQRRYRRKCGHRVAEVPRVRRPREERLGDFIVWRDENGELQTRRWRNAETEPATATP